MTIHGQGAAGDKTPIDRSEYLAIFLLLFLLWGLHVFFISPLSFTGDEIRYVSYGLGISKGEGFYASNETWGEFLQTFNSWGVQKESPSLAKGGLIHSVIYPIIGSWAMASHQLSGARWVSFGVGALGAIILFFALRRENAARASLAAIAAILFTCPLIFYFRLFFSEIFLFLINCLLVFFLTSKTSCSTRRLYGLSIFFCLFPFFHLKMSLEGVAAFALTWLTYRKEGGPWKHRIGAIVIGFAFFVLYLFYNKHFFGAYIGGASAAFPVTPLAIPGRILINLFDFHHGLIANAPVMIVAFVGLFYGLRRKDPVMRRVCVVFAAYFFTMLWANGSESYASRNWCAAMPFLAFGFARWAGEAGFSRKLFAMPFFALTICLALLAVKSPNLFLDARNYALQYDALFSYIPYFHFGYLLPYDFLDHAGAGLHTALPLGIPVFCVLALFAAGQLATGKRRAIGMACQIVALSAIFYFGFVEEYKDVSVSMTRDNETRYLNMKLFSPREIAFIRISNPPAVLKQYGYLNVWIEENGEWRFSEEKASVILPEPPMRCATAVLVSETPDKSGRIWLDTANGAKIFVRRLSLFPCS